VSWEPLGSRGSRHSGALWVQGFFFLCRCLLPCRTFVSRRGRYHLRPCAPFPATCRRSTIPYWLVILIGVLSIVGSILAAELWLARHGYADASDALAACLYFFLDAVSAFFVTGMATEVGPGCCVRDPAAYTFMDAQLSRARPAALLQLLL